MLFHQVIDIKVRWWRNCLGAGWHIHHLSRTKILKLARILYQGNSSASLQDEQFVPAYAFQDDSRAGNGDAHATRGNAAAAGIFRDAKKDRAALNLGVVPGLIETENRVCAQTGDRQIDESKLRA